MPGNFPAEIDTFREVENLPTVTFKETDKRTLFADDINAITSAILAIENEILAMRQRIANLEP